jgi:hypothetical protein
LKLAGSRTFKKSGIVSLDYVVEYEPD